MSMIQSDLLLGQEGGAGYAISRSLRFSSIDSAYLSRNVSLETNRKTFTFAAWVKRNKLGSGDYYLFHGVGGSGGLAGYTLLGFSADQLWFNDGFSGAITSTAKFRDPSAWYHVVFAVDSTQATDSNRVKMHVNGVQLTSFSSAAWPSLNRDFTINAAVQHTIGWYFSASNDFLLADVHFIDGQALTPSSFTEVSATTGQLIPKAYTGSFGTNGFWLKFSDNSAATATTLGKDYSGNSNNWSPSNLSVTAGAGNDSLVDTPTSYGTDTGAGGEVRGNYATLNPLHSYVSTASNGNLDCTSNGGGWIGSTIHVTSGKWYVEYTVGATGIIQMFGVCTSTHSGSGYPWLASTPGVTYYVSDGRIYVDGVNTGATTGATNGDIISLSFDVDAKSVVVRKNNSVLSTKTIGTTSSYMFYISDGGGNATSSINFGQRPFAYTAPSGFKALCDTNLTAPTIAKPSTVMDVALWTGNGAASRTISGLGFSPDLVWIKSRSTAGWHALVDQVRGAGKILASNDTASEYNNTGSNNAFQAFTSDGFTIGQQASWVVNDNSVTQAAWAWDAGSSTVTNTQGSITSQVRANASAGFSIVTYTGTGANATVGHGLGVAPSLVIIKSRTSARNWIVWHNAFGSAGSTDYLYLNSTLAKGGDGGDLWWNNTVPSSSIFSLGSSVAVNDLSYNYVAYCFAPVAGYSSFGSYTGNNSADGPFQWCGFRPRWLLIKSVGYAADWIIVDAARETYNVMQKALFPNQSYYEAQASTALRVDFLSNGFKIRSTDGNAEGWNYPSNSHVWAAFAESPFQYARAR